MHLLFFSLLLYYVKSEAIPLTINTEKVDSLKYPGEIVYSLNLGENRTQEDLSLILEAIDDGRNFYDPDLFVSLVI